MRRWLDTIRPVPSCGDGDHLVAGKHTVLPDGPLPSLVRRSCNDLAPGDGSSSSILYVLWSKAWRCWPVQEPRPGAHVPGLAMAKKPLDVRIVSLPLAWSCGLLSPKIHPDRSNQLLYLGCQCLMAGRKSFSGS